MSLVLFHEVSSPCMLVVLRIYDDTLTPVLAVLILIFVFDLVFLKIFEPLDKSTSKQPGLLLV